MSYFFCRVSFLHPCVRDRVLAPGRNAEMALRCCCVAWRFVVRRGGKFRSSDRSLPILACPVCAYTALCTTRAFRGRKRRGLYWAWPTGCRLRASTPERPRRIPRWLTIACSHPFNLLSFRLGVFGRGHGRVRVRACLSRQVNAFLRFAARFTAHRYAFHPNPASGGR